MKLKRFSSQHPDEADYHVDAHKNILGKDLYMRNRPKKFRYHWIKIFFIWFFLVVFSVAISYGAFFSYKIYRVGNKIQI